DGHVTGVQTCALPISVAASLWWPVAILLGILAVWVVAFFRDPLRAGPRGERYVLAAAEGHVVHVIETEEPMYVKERAVRISIFRSEERRVGKECRTRL